MSTALVSVDICNLALDLLRQKEQVMALTGDDMSELDALAARWYDVTRRSVLRSFPWNFARKRKILSRNATAPEFGFADAYNLPSDYIELVFVGTNYTDDYETEYSIESGKILIDNSGATTLNVCYIFDTEEVGNFDPLFVDLFSAELAIRMSNQITGLNKSMKDIWAWKKALEIQARAKSGQENLPRVRYVSPLLSARRGLIRSSISSDGTHLL